MMYTAGATTEGSASSQFFSFFFFTFQDRELTSSSSSTAAAAGGALSVGILTRRHVEMWSGSWFSSSSSSSWSDHGRRKNLRVRQCHSNMPRPRANRSVASNLLVVSDWESAEPWTVVYIHTPARRQRRRRRPLPCGRESNPNGESKGLRRIF